MNPAREMVHPNPSCQDVWYTTCMRLNSASVTPALAQPSVRLTQKLFHRRGDRIAGSALHCVSQVGHLHVLYCTVARYCALL